MVTVCYPELAMAYTTEQKVAAVYRVTVRGEQAQLVAKGLGCSRTTLRGWCRSPAITDRVKAMREQVPASRSETPSRPLDPSKPILDDLQRPRLFNALEQGLPVPIALRVAGLSPKAHEYWSERAGAGDAECQTLVKTIDRISAEFALRMMRQAVSTESGAKNAQWALRCLWREFFGEHAPDKAAGRSPLEAYTEEQLRAIAS